MIENKKLFYLIVSQSVCMPVSEKTCSMNFTILGLLFSLEKETVAELLFTLKNWKGNTFIGSYMSYLLSCSDSGSASADVSWNRIAKARIRNRRRSDLEDFIRTLLVSFT